MLIEFRWIIWDLAQGPPPMNAIANGSPPQITYKVLQYRQRMNIKEMGLQEPIWSEWLDT